MIVNKIEAMFSSLDTLIIYFLSFFVLLIFIYFKWAFFDSKTTKNLPPSPLRIPIIGNLHQLGLNPHRSLSTLAQKHGSLMLLHLGSVPVVLASSAEVAQEIMKTHDLIFSSRATTRIQKSLTYDAKNVAFSPYGEYWRQVKTIEVLHLLSAKRVKSFRQVREDEMTLMIDSIESSCHSVIDLSSILILLTNNVISRVALGRKYSESKFKDMMGELMEILGVFSIGSYIPSLSWVDRLSGLEARANKITKQNDDFFERVIEEHLDKKKGTVIGGGSDQNVGSQDLVDILLEIQRESKTTNFPIYKDTIKSLILEMFVAGTDTTFTILEWTISELIRHPKAIKKLQQEVREIAQGRPKITEEDLENNQYPYLKAVIKETMRLHTPLPLLVPRESTQDVKINGYDIAAGTQVMINVWAIARDLKLWDEPEAFRPERFLNSSIDYKGHHFEFLPFGAGRRGCPGIQFATVVNELALANLVYKFDFILPNDGRVEELDMSEVFGITVHKKSPILVVATPCF